MLSSFVCILRGIFFTFYIISAEIIYLFILEFQVQKEFSERHKTIFVRREAKQTGLFFSRGARIHFYFCSFSVSRDSQTGHSFDLHISPHTHTHRDTPFFFALKVLCLDNA